MLQACLGQHKIAYSRGVARNLGEGVLDYARKNLSHAHLLMVRSKFKLSQRTRSECSFSKLVQDFRPNLGIR